VTLYHQSSGIFILFFRPKIVKPILTYLLTLNYNVCSYFSSVAVAKDIEEQNMQMSFDVRYVGKGNL